MNDIVKKALEMYREDLIKILTKNESKLEIRKIKIKAKNEVLLQEYKTENDINEAYGVGIISSKKRDYLQGLLNGVTDDESSLEAYINMLKREIKGINTELSCKEEGGTNE